MATYYAGKSGGFDIAELPAGTFKIDKWTYVADRGLIDVSCTNTLGTECYIGNLKAGTVKATGYVTLELVSEFNLFGFAAGDEITLNLYVDDVAKVGFRDIYAIIDDITFEDDVSGVATFELTALISLPKANL